MECLVFDVKGDMGHFTKMYSVKSPTTYPLPPPTAIAGMVGAIVGHDREENLKVFAENEWKVSVRLLSKVKIFRTSWNKVNTKTALFFGSNPRAGFKEHSPTPCEFLKDPSFRIYFWSESQELMNKLEGFLQEGLSSYTPCLGWANCLAEISFVGRFASQEVSGGIGGVKIDSVVPVAAVRSLDHRGQVRFDRFRVYSRLAPDRSVSRFEELYVDKDGGQTKVQTDSYCEVNGENILFF